MPSLSSSAHASSYDLPSASKAVAHQIDGVWPYGTHGRVPLRAEREASRWSVLALGRENSTSSASMFARAIRLQRREYGRPKAETRTYAGGRILEVPAPSLLWGEAFEPEFIAEVVEV